MIIACPECEAKYNLPDEKLASGPVKVKCKKCETVFEAKAPDSEPEPPASEQDSAAADDFGFDEFGGDVGTKADDADDFGFDDELDDGFGADAPASDDDFDFGDDGDLASPGAESDDAGGDEFDFGDDFAQPDESPAEEPVADDFGFGEELDDGAAADDTAGTTNEASDDFNFGDDFDDPAGDDAADDFDFDDDFGDAAPADSQPAPPAPAAADDDDDLDSLFDEDDEPAASTDDSGNELDETAFGFDEDTGSGEDDVYYDEDFDDGDFEAEIERQVEGADDDSESGIDDDFLGGDDDDTFAIPESDDDLITTLEQLSKTAEKKRFPVLPVVGGVVGVIATAFAFVYFAPATARSIPGIGPGVLALHEALDTKYHYDRILAEVWESARTKIDTWLPENVAAAQSDLEELLSTDPNHQDGVLYAGRSAFFLQAIAQRQTAPIAAAKGKPVYEAYRNALAGAEVKGSGDPDTTLAAGWSLFQNRKIDEALVALTATSELPDPVSVLAALAAARIYEDLGNTDDELRMLAVALKGDPDNAWIGLWEAETLWSTGQSKELLFKKIKTLSSSIGSLQPQEQRTFFELAARVALAVDQVQPAATFVGKGLSVKPNDATLLTLKAKTMMANSRWADANMLAEQARAADAQLTEAKIVHAQTMARINRVEDAIALLRNTVQSEPQSADAAAALVEMLLEQEQFEQAEAAYERARDYVEGDPRLVKLGADIAIRMGDVETAQDRLSDYQATNPNDINMMLQLAEINQSLGQLAAAEKQLRALTETRPDFVSAKVKLGEVLLAQGKAKEAELVLSDALSRDTQLPKTYVLLAETYIAQKLYSDADQALSEAMKLAPNLWPIHLLMGQLRLAQERPQEAMISIEKAVDVSGGVPKTRLWLARSLEALNRPGRALEQYDLILKTDPDHLEALQKASMGYVAVDDWNRALDYLAKWNEVQPSHGDPYLYIGRGRLNTGDVDGALKILEQGVRRFASSAKMNSELGWTYMQSGNTAMAGKYLQRSESLDTAYALNQYRLGFYYKEKNQTTAAKRAFQKALRLGGLSEENRLGAEQALQALSY